MAEIFQVILNGMIIGILISAPMGPIGMLVIQRTLNRGRWPAFFTGIGAAISDLLYCLMCGFGISFVTGFISRNEMILQILGSLVLIAFAIYLINKNPARALQKPKDHANNFWSDFVTGFLFTFANPLILFFIISLFARFNFLLPEFTIYHYATGFAFIFGGALIWWYTVTYFVNKVRAHFNVRSMWLINRIIGAILMIMAIFGLYKGIRGYLELLKEQRHNDNITALIDYDRTHYCKISGSTLQIHTSAASSAVRQVKDF